MKVLIITHIFWPESADFKNMALATELVARGHEVTVLTAFPNYPLGRLYDGYRLSWRQWEVVNGVRILRVPLYPDQSASGSRRSLNYGSFTLTASTIGLLAAGKADVVFVYSPPMTLGLAGGVFKAVRRAPVLLDVVDLWPEAVLGSGMVKSGAIVGIAAWIAKTSYRIADQITVPTDGFASQLQSVGVPAAKVTVVPNWADGELYYQSERDLAFGDEFGLRDKMCVIHAGNIGPFQDIENVLSAAQLLRHDDHLRFVFVGGGRDLEKMRVLKKDRKLDNVVFAGFYPAERMSGILAWGDALLVSLKADPYLAINLPGKLPSYMATGRPIIACADGEASQLVLTKGLGSSCEPGNAAALASTIQRFMGLPVESRLEIGARCRQVFEALFEKNRLIGKYVSMLEHLANR